MNAQAERPLVAVRLEETSGVLIVGTPCDVCGRAFRGSDTIGHQQAERGKALFVAHARCAERAVANGRR